MLMRVFLYCYCVEECCATPGPVPTPSQLSKSRTIWEESQVQPLSYSFLLLSSNYAHHSVGHIFSSNEIGGLAESIELFIYL
jgi:hypothetical protein